MDTLEQEYSLTYLPAEVLLSVLLWVAILAMVFVHIFILLYILIMLVAWEKPNQVIISS